MKKGLMNPEEARARFVNEEDPLDLSIEKYRRLIAEKDNPYLKHELMVYHLDASTCGLCMKWYEWLDCGLCPLRKKWGSACDDEQKSTLWADMFRAFWGGHYDEMFEHAERLLADLEDIKTERDNEQLKAV